MTTGSSVARPVGNLCGRVTIDIAFLPCTTNGHAKGARFGNALLHLASLRRRFPTIFNLVKPRVYLETTIPSYLVAWPRTNVVIVGHQQTTREWWATYSERFDLFISQFVLDEAARGDADAAVERLAALAGIPELAADADAQFLAVALLAPQAPGKCADRCRPHRRCRGSWNELPRHMELPPHRQRAKRSAHPRGLRAARLEMPRDLHAGTTEICRRKRNTMIDIIVEEVRRHRAEIGAENGNDLLCIFEDALPGRVSTTGLLYPSSSRAAA